MVVHSSIRQLEELDINIFFDLQSEQLLDRESIFFTRLVFCDDPNKQHQEIIKYSKDANYFSKDFINYLKSEKWLIDYPEAFTVERINLDNPQLYSYICPWGYTNHRPEYIQVIADRPLLANSQKYLQRSAILLNKYQQLYREWTWQKAESKLLQETIQNISHQLRNSVSLIALCTKNLWFSLKDSPVQSQAQIICDGIQNLDIVLTESIDFSQSLTPRLVPQDLRNLINESLKKLQPLIQQKNLKISIPETSALLTVKRSQMRQVFDNLLSNAVHFSPVDKTISCSWQIFQKEILINISDEGPGLSPEDLTKIFTPFYSHREGGTGLGLTIAQKIVLGHQGRLWAENLGAGGARFSLILPHKI